MKKFTVWDHETHRTAGAIVGTAREILSIYKKVLDHAYESHGRICIEEWDAYWDAFDAEVPAAFEWSVYVFVYGKGILCKVVDGRQWLRDIMVTGRYTVK